MNFQERQGVYKMESSKIYLCKTDCSILGNILGLKIETCSLKKHAVEQWEITFDVEKYTSDNSCELRQSDYYDSIDTMMRLYLDGKDQVFFVIDSEPVIKGEGLQEIKTVTAHSIECELSARPIKNFKINCGTKDSQEYLATDSNGNFYNINPYTNLPYEYVSLVNYENSQLSLLHLALQNTGWTVSENIDSEICSIKKSFDVSGTNIYDFFVNTVSPSVSVIFQFDRKHKKVSLVKAENFGEDTGIFVTMRNLMNSFEITSSANDDLITKLIPTGADNLGIEQINFGKNYITNLDYFMNILNEYGDYKYVSKELHDKYVLWKEYRETEKITFNGKQCTRREQYITLSKLYNKTILDINDLKNRVPNDGSVTDYKTFSLKELKLHLNAFNKALVSLITLYKNEYGVTEIGNAPNYTPTPSSATNIKDTPYWHDFYAYQESIIPQIKEALKMYCQTDSNGNLVTDTNGHFIEMEFGNPAYYADPNIVKEIDAYKYEWSLYGLDELESKKKAWCEVVNLLFNECFIKSGTIAAPTAYRTPDDNGWNSLSDQQKKEFTSKSAFIDKLNQYLDYMSFDARNNSLTKTKCKGIIRQCDDTIRARKNEIDSLENLQKNYQAQRNELANSVAIEKFKYNDILLFTEEDLNVINSMIRETDYSNPNILTTNLDDIVISIDAQEELYQVASEELYKLSQPQYSFSTDMDNLYALEEFQCYHDDFEVGNFIRAGFEIHEELFDNEFIKLRLMSITYNPLDLSSQDISVEFSTMTKELDGVSDLASILGVNNSSSSGSSSGSSSSGGGGTYGNNDSNVQMSNNMINALLSTELFGTTVTDVILDNIKANKGNFNTLLSHSGIFDLLEAGRIKVSGECLFDHIKSSNYVDGKSGSMMNLTDGSFSFASGSLAYNPQQGLIIKGVATDSSLQTLVDNLANGITNVNGACITTGLLKSANWNGSTSNPIGNTQGSILCLPDGKFNLGGGKLKWDGENLQINGNGKFTGEIQGTSGTFYGNITATTLTANQSGTIAGWTIDSEGFHRNNDESFTQSIDSSGISIGDFYFVRPDGFSMTDTKYYNKIKEYNNEDKVLNPPISLYGSDIGNDVENYIYIYAFGNNPDTINLYGDFRENVEDTDLENKNKSIAVSETMIYEKINNYMKICMKVDDIFFGYHFDDVPHFFTAVAILKSIGLSDENNNQIGIFKIEVYSYKTNTIKRTIYFNNVREHTDFVINSLFGQISLKTMDFHPLGINAFSEFEFNIYSNDKSNVDPKVTISSSSLKHTGVYDSTVSSGSQLRISEDGTIHRYSSSSKRYKKDVTDEIPSELNPQKLYDLNIVSYKYKDNYLPVNDQRYKHNILGFIAEDVYEKYPEACNLNDDGTPEMWEINILFPAALKLIQEQHKEIIVLSEQIETMKQQFQELKSRIIGQHSL